jgi:Domain of unknown function (DUF4911)
MSDNDVVPIYLRVAPRDIALLKFVVESYEGVGIVRTVDPTAAVIVVLVAPDFLATARSILASLAELVVWEEVSKPAGSDDGPMRTEGDVEEG